MPQVRYLLALISAALTPGFCVASQPDSKAETAAGAETVGDLAARANGVQWGKYLDLGALRRELGRTGPVDAVAVKEVLAKLNSGRKGSTGLNSNSCKARWAPGWTSLACPAPKPWATR